MAQPSQRANIQESSTDSLATKCSHVDALTDVTTTETDVTENELQVEAEDEFYFNSGQTLTFVKNDLHQFEEPTRNYKLTSQPTTLSPPPTSGPCKSICDQTDASTLSDRDLECREDVARIA